MEPHWPTRHGRSSQSGRRCVRSRVLPSSKLPTLSVLPPLAEQPLHADAPAPVGIYKDPTTSTPFPSRLTSPDGTQLRLVGTGVRTVSFLNIKVYAVGFYVSEQELQWAKDGKIAGWEVSPLLQPSSLRSPSSQVSLTQGFTPERLIPPFGIPSGEPDRPKGELLMESLLEKADAAIVISASSPPLHSTDKAHKTRAYSC